jgi:hypothetical protein
MNSNAGETNSPTRDRSDDIYVAFDAGAQFCRTLKKIGILSVKTDVSLLRYAISSLSNTLGSLKAELTVWE